MSSKPDAAVVWLALAVSDSALAHSPIEGVDNFYNGLLHPVFVPAHLLLLVAVGLFFGQQGPGRVRAALGVYAPAIVSGLTAAWFSMTAGVETFILMLSSALGLLIAASPVAGSVWSLVIAVMAGFSLGVDSVQETLSGRDKLITLFGSGIAIYLLPLYPMALADYFQKKSWQKIGIRVFGSWIAASSLLVLALSFSARQ